MIAAPDSSEPIAIVGVTDRIDPSNAPRPTNEGERLLFRQLYETLVRADCRGRAASGLAASWRLDGDGRTWIVTLRENARFSDGTQVTAADVRSSWIRDGHSGELRQDVSRLVESAVAVDDRTLAIALRSRRTDVPLALVHPDLSVAKAVADSPWPLGSRSAQIAPADDASRRTSASALTLTRQHLPALRFVVAPGDPRDLLDHGIDILLTRDAAALEYAATLPQFQSVPLAWQRTHVLLTPGRARTSPSLPEDARQALADDAVRGEARGARGPFWWENLANCDVAPPLQIQPLAAQRIVYDANDGAARDLAERLVGLARASGPAAATFLDALLPDRPRRTYQRAAGLTGEALALARRAGTDAGYVVSLESRPVDPCRDLQTLIDSVRWLDPETIVPLVETRLHAVVRRGRASATAEWDGVVLAGSNSTR